MSDMLEKLMQAIRETLTPEEYQEYLERLEKAEPIEMIGYYAVLGRHEQ
jgi:hypothetical protein